MIWVPMWDGFKKLTWKRRLAYRFSNVHVISFCQKIHDYLQSIKIPSLAVQYYPCPTPTSTTVKRNSPYTLFLWQRDPSINLSTVAQLFPRGHIKKVIFKSDLTSEDNSQYPFEVEKIEGWISRELLSEKMKEADYYVAPRRQEGIGFSFLEAMALSKIVVGFNDATMNEYVKHGNTGYLFDELREPIRDLQDPHTLQTEITAFGQRAFERWQNQRVQIKQLLDSGVR